MQTGADPHVHGPAALAALSQTRFRIAGFGSALPSEVVTNDDLVDRLGLDAGWIESRCGIRRRHVAGPGDTTHTLAVAAAADAMAAVPAWRPDCVICATFTPDYRLCPTAPAIARSLGLGPIAAFDLNAACSGGALGLLTAVSFIAAGTFERVLLVAADTTTRHLARDDARTQILFGDGAAALLLERDAQCGIAVRSWLAGSDGTGASFFHVPRGQDAVSMRGRELFRFATQKGAEVLHDACAQAGIAPSGVDRVVVHQANLRIVECLQERTGIAPEKWTVNIGMIGNTAAASVLFALTDMLRSGALEDGTRVLLAAFGAGLTWCAGVLEWGVSAPAAIAARDSRTSIAHGAMTRPRRHRPAPSLAA
jgi:3-oxoacyl-[acyl-carrier-protein] synthase-3